MGRTPITALALSAFIVPPSVMATDTLDCHGGGYHFEFHIGSEGIADYTIYQSNKRISSGDVKTLITHNVYWGDNPDDFSENYIEASSYLHADRRFMVDLKGEKGRYSVDGVVGELRCDWLR